MHIFVQLNVTEMNTRQLYITMFLLMVLWIIFQRNNRNDERAIPVVNEKEQLLYKGGPLLEDVLKRKSGQKYPIGLTLSGGGIKSLCHVGVLKALEEEGFRPDIISGVSAGAVVAALYADGYTPDSILSLIQNVRYTEFFRLEVPHGGLFTLTGFKEYLDTLLHATTFEELKIPIRVVATDLDGGRSVVFEKGPLLDALVATCSVPILFSPYMINGVNYVDGGVLMNLPASVIRSDCNYLIGVSVGPLDTHPYEKSITNIALRSYKFLFRSSTKYDKELCDMLIEPASIAHYKGSDVMQEEVIFQIGYLETKRMLQEQRILKASSKIK